MSTDALPQVRISPDYSAPSPLWPSADETDALVSVDLLARLIAWQEGFDANFHWETGWRSEPAKVRWAEDADVLVAELREALEGKAELTVDLWPLSPRLT
jgi:hypothetical protein